MRVLTFGLSPVIQLGVRNPRKKDRKISSGLAKVIKLGIHHLGTKEEWSGMLPTRGSDIN